MELDATQALDTDYGDEEMEETEDRKIQVAELRVQKTKGFEANNFIIYEGQNIIGRHEKADVYIPLKPLSKKHACIEVTSGQHFIYDFGSKNKTRRGKMILRPNVRYELTDGCRLLFADVQCEYKFIEAPEERDDTDSMSEAGSESMLLIEDSMIENENDKSMGSDKSSILQQEQQTQIIGDSNSMKKEGGTEKQKLNMTDDDIYAAETDSDTDNERDRPGGATPAPSSQFISIVKQTPGMPLHQIHRGSLNDTADSTKLINDSMQSFEASNLSLKLDITQGSETTLSPQTNQSKNKQSQTNEIATLVLQEPNNEADDTETAKTALLHSSNLGLTENRNARLKETVSPSEEPSAYPKEAVRLSAEPGAIPKETGGLLIQESDEESTDMSDNEAMKSEIAGSGFFSPDLLLQKYGIKKLDGSSGTDRSDAELLFSPGVVRSSCDVTRSKQVVKDDTEGGGENEENSRNEDNTSQEYMLMPTQAYGVMDSENDSTDVEDHDGNVANNRNEKLHANTESKQMKENNSQKSKSKIDQNSMNVQMQDTVPLEFDPAPFRGSRAVDKEQTGPTVPTMEPTMPLEASPPMEATVLNETAVSNKLSPSKDLSTAKYRIAPIDNFSQTAETISLQDSGTTEVSMNDSITASALYDSMQEADTISTHESEAFDKMMDKNASQSHSEATATSCDEQESSTVLLPDSNQEAGTVLLQDAVEDATTDPQRDIEQDAVTVPLQDIGQGIATVPAHDSDHETTTVPLQNSVQEAATFPVHDSDPETATVPLQNSDQEAATVQVHDSDQEAFTVQLQDTSSLEETVPLTETGDIFDNAPTLQIADTVPVQDEAPSYSCDEEATQGYDILPPRKPVEKRKDKSSSEPMSTFTLPGGSTLKHVTWGAGAAQVNTSSKQRQRTNTESSDIEEAQAYDGDDDCATQAYGVEAATVPYDRGEQEVVEETQEDDDTNTATQAYGYIDQPTLLYESPVASPAESRTGHAQETDAEECATQAYGILEQPTVPYDDKDGGLDENDSNNVDNTDGEDCATQAYGLLDQATVPYDYEDAGSNENDSKHTNEEVDDCATQAYGLLDQPTVPYDLQRDDQDHGSAIDDCATQAYGLQDQATLSYELRPESPAKHGDAEIHEAVDECETQAYGLEDDPAGHSEDEDCATQAYGIMDMATVPYEEAADSPMEDSNRTDRGSHEESHEEKEDQSSESLFVKPAVLLRSRDGGRHEESQDEKEDHSSKSLFVKPAVPPRSRGKTKMAASSVPISNKETKDDGSSINSQATGRRSLKDRDKKSKESVPDSKEGRTSRKSQGAGKQSLKNRGKKNEESELEVTVDQGLEHLVLAEAKEQANKERGRGKKSVRNNVSFADDDKNFDYKAMSESEVGNEGMQVTTEAKADRRKKTATTRRKTASVAKNTGANQIVVTAEKQRDIVDEERSRTAADQEDPMIMSGSATAKRGRTTKRGGKASALENLDKTIETVEEWVGVNVKDDKAELTEVGKDSTEKEAASKMKGGKPVKQGKPSKKKRVGEASMDEEGAATAKDSVAPQPAEEEISRNDKDKDSKRGIAAKQDRASGERTIAVDPVGREIDNESEQGISKCKETEASKSTKRGVAAKRGRASADRTSEDVPVDKEEGLKDNNSGRNNSNQAEGDKSAKRGAAAKRGRASADRTSEDVPVDKEEGLKGSDSGREKSNPRQEEAGKSAKRGAAAKRGRASADRTSEDVPVDKEEGLKDNNSGRNNSNQAEGDKSAKRGAAAKRGRASADETSEDVSVDKEEGLKDNDSVRDSSKPRENEAKGNNLKRKSANRGRSAKGERSSTKRTKGADTGEENNMKETESETITESDSKTEASTRNMKSKTTKVSVPLNDNKDTTDATDVPKEKQTPSTSAASCSADEFDARSSGSRGRKRGKQSLAMNQNRLSDTEDSPGPSKKNAMEESAAGNKSAKGRTPRGKSTASKLTDGSPTMKSPSSRPTLRDLDEVPKIMFTGLTDKSVEKSVTQLGAELADSVYDATHLVTDKVRRTVKFLCCLARGIAIVDPSWLEHCRSAKEFTDTEKYTVKDKNTEKQYNFDLKRSIAKAKEKELLDGYSLYVTKNVKPEQKQMKDIIQCSGGKALLKLPKNLDEKTLIISCEEDTTELKGLTQSGIPVYSAELLLTGILRQELDFEQFKLDVGSESTKKAGKRTQSTSELDKSVSSAKRRKR